MTSLRWGMSISLNSPYLQQIKTLSLYLWWLAIKFRKAENTYMFVLYLFYKSTLYWKHLCLANFEEKRKYTSKAKNFISDSLNLNLTRKHVLEFLWWSLFDSIKKRTKVSMWSSGLLLYILGLEVVKNGIHGLRTWFGSGRGWCTWQGGW